MGKRVGSVGRVYAIIRVQVELFLKGRLIFQPKIHIKRIAIKN